MHESSSTLPCHLMSELIKSGSGAFLAESGVQKCFSQWLKGLSVACAASHELGSRRINIRGEIRWWKLSVARFCCKSAWMGPSADLGEQLELLPGCAFGGQVGKHPHDSSGAKLWLWEPRAPAWLAAGPSSNWWWWEMLHSEQAQADTSP